MTGTLNNPRHTKYVFHSRLRFALMSRYPYFCQDFHSLFIPPSLLLGLGSPYPQVGEAFAGIQESNAPSVVAATAGASASIQALGRQHVGLANTLSQDVCKSLGAYVDQQSAMLRGMIQEVHALVEDLEKEKAAHKKIRDKHKKACKEAEGVLKKGGALSLPPVPPPLSQLPDAIDVAVAAPPSLPSSLPPSLPPSTAADPISGPDHSDATSSPIPPSAPPSVPAVSSSILRLQDRAQEALFDLRAMEKEYQTSKNRMEGKEEAFRRALREHLGRFQVGMRRNKGGRGGEREKSEKGRRERPSVPSVETSLPL